MGRATRNALPIRTHDVDKNSLIAATAEDPCHGSRAAPAVLMSQLRKSSRLRSQPNKSNKISCLQGWALPSRPKSLVRHVIAGVGAGLDDFRNGSDR